MKTFDEVELHLLTTGYKSCELDKICGYLIGTGIKEPDIELTILIGDGTFEEFYAWFNGDADDLDTDECDCPSCTLCSILTDIAERMLNADTIDEQSYFANQLEFLINEFDLDSEDGE